MTNLEKYGPKVVIIAREKDWDFLAETLYLDSQSIAFTREVRGQITAALSRLEWYERKALKITKKEAE